ncbi:hypothetical protein CHF27_013025 [Romboutsia maritimum]|uniref:Uncharacterized protein n=1 Tax=Romboutsia maritimum TaxID=2020948 RepID=A0A371IPV6_9FIRM|nr:hypothetical protein [Romboutsia maritimum]RDY22507.1 hypothetical protein CHF27_013025 [Romboutsia maritimum]
MKKNKTIAYMMAATLLIGGASLGTKALFSDQAEAKVNDLIITMGNLHVKVDEGDGWILKSGNKTVINSL